jgi:hypothetical protein
MYTEASSMLVLGHVGSMYLQHRSKALEKILPDPPRDECSLLEWKIEKLSEFHSLHAAMQPCL